MTLSYQERKERGLCTYPGCDKTAEDTNLCKRHRAKYRRRKAKNYRVSRGRWRARKRCMRCGRARRPGSKWCLRCLIAHGKLNAMERNKARNKRSELIRDRTVATTEGDGRTRNRFRGQPRTGPQSRAQLDDQDCNDAERALRRGREGLAAARAPEMDEVPRAQRIDAEHAALAQLAHARRFLDEVFERNRYRAVDSDPESEAG